MFKKKRILALISARGGSKGLPNKNIMEIAGKPLIAWTIEQAKRVKYIDKIVVSTDSKKIMEISKTYGAETPFLRPKRLAQDDSKLTDVILHAIKWLKNIEKEEYDLILSLQPTSPLREPKDINNALDLLLRKKAQAVISVCECERHPYWSNVLAKDRCLKGFLKPELIHKIRQKLPVFYRLNGAIQLAYREYLLEQKSFFGDKTFAYIMPIERSVDIDSKIEFCFAEFLLTR